MLDHASPPRRVPRRRLIAVAARLAGALGMSALAACDARVAGAASTGTSLAVVGEPAIVGRVAADDQPQPPGAGAAPPDSPTGDSSSAATSAPDYLAWAHPGPYVAPAWSDFGVAGFSSQQAVVFTYFFYWYRYLWWAARVKALGRDFYLLHPTDFTETDFLNQAWYEHQFADMLSAGIDVFLPDYWGEPGQYPHAVPPAPEQNLFATQGLPPMIAALQALAARGTPLKVGMFLDTTILQNEDLTTDRGKQIFYAAIRDYFSRIPPSLWAAIDGRPVLWLYDAQKVAAFDQSTFDYVYAQFALDFGGLRPYVVREWQWYTAKNVPAEAGQTIQTEGLYGWGAAPSGFNADPRFTVAQAGPGFDNAHFGRPDGLRTARRGGAYYVENLERALASGRRLLAIETWNELGETSGILDTVEYGRQYIDITRTYADLFKKRYPAPLTPG